MSKKRTRHHVMETESEYLVGQLIPSDWIIRSIPKDYGVDIEIEIVDQEIVSGRRVWVQLKASEMVEKKEVEYDVAESVQDLIEGENISAEYIPFSMKVEDIKYYLSCSFPVLLFLSDLKKEEVYWLPIQDEVDVNLNEHNKDWKNQKYATLRLPVWNKLSWEKDNDYPGLRWYALEPARMYAFARLHYYYHEFKATGRLSGYVIGDGWIDHGEEEELKSSLELALDFVQESLNRKVLFGEMGIDFLKKPNPFQRLKGVAVQLEQSIEKAEKALDMLDRDEYDWRHMASLVGDVHSAIELLSTTISMYQGFRNKFLLSEGAAVWRATSHIHGNEGAPILPLSRNPNLDRA